VVSRRALRFVVVACALGCGRVGFGPLDPDAGPDGRGMDAGETRLDGGMDAGEARGDAGLDGGGLALQEGGLGDATLGLDAALDRDGDAGPAPECTSVCFCLDPAVDCGFQCSSPGGCNLLCADGVGCELGCAAGGCNLDCGVNGRCRMGCGGGGCSMRCDQSDLCVLECPAESCDVAAICGGLPVPGFCGLTCLPGTGTCAGT